MGRSLYRRLLIPLSLLLAAAAAPSAPPPEELAYRQAASLAAAGDWNALETFTTAALQRFGHSDADAVWGLRPYLAMAILGKDRAEEAAALLATPLPARLVATEIGVRWVTYRACSAYRLKNFAEAEQLLDAAEKIARKSQPRMIAEVLVYRANCAFSQKRFDVGLRYARASRSEATIYSDRRIEMKALGTIALLLTSQGRFVQAVEADLKVIEAARSFGDNATLQKVEGNLAWAYTAIGEYDLAYENFNLALAQSLKLGAERDSIVWMNQVADAAHRNGDYPAALNMYRRGVAAARKSRHPDLGEFLTNLGVAQLETGDAGAARASVREALAVSSGNDEQTLGATLLDARIDAANGTLDDAIIKCRRVITRASSKPLRWEAQGRLAQVYVAAKQPAEAENEFRRAIETASEARKAIEKEELRLPFGTLVREVYDAYIDFLVSNRPPEEALVAAERSRAQTLEEALQGSETRRRIDPRRIARDHNAVVLAYWLARPRSFVWIVTPSSVDVVALPAAPVIDRQVDAYARQLANLGTPEDTLRKNGADLFATLVGETTARIGAASRIIVVPDGRLHAFNMETLVVPNTRRYWIEDVTLVTAASLELLDRAHLTASPSSMLLVGDPPSPDPEFPSLKNGAKEIRLVASHFPTHTILAGSDATPSAYERAGAERSGYIHFVAHGVAIRQVPLDSAVVLGRDTRNGDEFKLYARDIIRKPLHARLVTISSCHGAGTRSYTGEGLVGLAWAFLHAGAQQVIAALWEVDEATTPQLMDDLYKGIQNGLDPASALRAAKLRLVHANSLRHRPFYWAPFVLYSGS
jgi:CHAT domain-containing protein/Tfp pilus assembly protein PilF